MGIGERQLISRIKSLSSKSLQRHRIGIGDDCAVLSLPTGHELLVTTDFSLERIHFRKEWHPPESVGHRCLTRGLSDIAAMGGKPVAAFLSLAVPANSDVWIKKFLKGLLALARQQGVQLSGGDTAQSPGGICADIVVLGTAPTRRALLRSGARPGDTIYVTGALGGSAAALSQLFRGRRKVVDRSFMREHQPHFYPAARVAVGQYLLQKRIATAAINISDGLSTDLSHICEESGVGARIEAEAIPTAAQAQEAGEVDALKLALHGGEDYELLFTARPGTRVPRAIAGVPVTKIGEIVASSKARMTLTLSQHGREHLLKPQGWEHFRKSRG